MEYWSDGVLERNWQTAPHHSITPSLQFSTASNNHKPIILLETGLGHSYLLISLLINKIAIHWPFLYLCAKTRKHGCKLYR